MRIRFVGDPNPSRFNKLAMIEPVTTAALIGGGASLLSSQGSKKAAKKSKPTVPDEIRPAFDPAIQLLRQRLTGGFPAFGGQLVAGLTPGQENLRGLASGLIGPGLAGFQDALSTQQQIAESGLDAETIRTLNETIDPFFREIERQRTPQLRETAAQRGGFFGTGALRAESDFLQQLDASQAKQVFDVAPIFQSLRLAAAGDVGRNLLSQQAFLGQGGQFEELARGIEQQGLTADFNEFLRRLPENAIPLLSNLLGSSPFGFNPVGTNFLQALGANAAQLAGNRDFISLLSGGSGSQSGTNPADLIGGFNLGGNTVGL
jgi:hypothetical protein